MVAASRDVERARQGAVELQRAIDRGELLAYFQPQIDLRTGRLVAMEALCRWRHPVRGMVAPDEFIPLAEQTGLIGAIDRVVLEQAALRAAEWHRMEHPVGLAFNVSPTELRPPFAASVLELVDALHLPPGSVTAEITETPELVETCEEHDTLVALIEGGVGVSIDDFGAGKTTVDQLVRIPFTEVKIDRTLLHDPSDAVDDLVAECVRLALTRSAIVVAEGVETAEDLERARRWGCHRAQGFYFSPAVAAEQLAPLLAIA